MKWIGWFCCVALFGLNIGINVSGSRRLAAEKQSLANQAANVATDEPTVRATAAAREKALHQAIADREKQLADIRAETTAVQAKAKPLEADLKQLMETARSVGATVITRPVGQKNERNAAEPPVNSAADAPQPSADAARIAALQQEIAKLRADIARVTLSP